MMRLVARIGILAVGLGIFWAINSLTAARWILSLLELFLTIVILTTMVLVDSRLKQQ